MKQARLALRDELIVDNFAGGGGASEAIRMALGREVDIAINHDEAAICMHTANHPETTHYCESVWDIDPIAVTRNQPVGLAWFSPDCKHFSKAKGGKPVEKKIRGLAWIVIRWAQLTRPRVIGLENVEEFEDWGPLVRREDGNMYPDPDRKGSTFRFWKGKLERLGYKVEYRVLRACDYGAPTIRKRLFLIARRDGLPIRWPKPTHGPGLIPYRTAAECIDWSIPCPSIFERKKPLAEKTLQRIARGIQKYVIESAEPFIVPLTHGGGPGRVYGMNEPLRTVTGAQRGEYGLVTPFLTEHANGSTQRNFDAAEPLRTQVAQVKGGHFALCSAFLAKHYGGVVGQAIDVPAGTVTGIDHHSLVTSHLMKLKGTCQHGQDVRDPMPTVQAQGLHIAEVRAFLINYYSNGSGKTGSTLKKPMPTVTSNDRIGLVTIHGVDYQIVDIGMRMLTPRELFSAQGFKDEYIIDPMFNGKPMTKTNQVKMCGNSVPPPVLAAILRENFQHELAYRVAAS